MDIIPLYPIVFIHITVFQTTNKSSVTEHFHFVNHHIPAKEISLLGLKILHHFGFPAGVVGGVDLRLCQMRDSFRGSRQNMSVGAHS